jgi:hypothetical protein
MKLDQSRHFFKQLLKYNLGILLNGQNLEGTLIVITKQFVSVWWQIEGKDVARTWSAIQSTGLCSGHGLYRSAQDLRHFLKLSNKSSHQFHIWPGNERVTEELVNERDEE